jgi:dipeptidyl-peptidase-3
MPTAEAVSTAYRFFAAELAAGEALVAEEQLRDTAVLARRLLARYLVEKARVVRFEGEDEQTYAVVPDEAAFRESVGGLLRQCQRILSSGDRSAALRLLNRYASPSAWPGTKGWPERARAAGLRRLTTCVMPKLTPHRDAAGKVRDVTISHKEGFERQMMRYRRY